MSLTVKELVSKLAPITSSLDALTVNNTTVNVQIAEMHQLLTNLSVKVDILFQSDDIKLNNVLKPKSKSKTKAKSKSKTKKSDDNDNTDDNDNDNTDDEPVVKPKKSKTPKTPANVDDGSDVIVVDGDAPLEDLKKITKKPKKKNVIDKVDKKTRKKDGKKKKAINKMEYFNKMYKNDENYFQLYLTDEVKSDINKENAEKWDKITDEYNVAKLRVKEYYNYMKNNHDKKLQDMKKKYIDDMEKKHADVVDKE